MSNNRFNGYAYEIENTSNKVNYIVPEGNGNNAEDYPTANAVVDFVNDVIDSKALLYEPIPDYMLPMGMTIGDVEGGRNVLVNSGIDTRKLNPTMKLIASGTTTAEVSQINITDTTGGEIVDDIGNAVVRAFNLSQHICIRVTIPKATAVAQLFIRLNNETAGGVANATSTSASKESRFEFTYSGGGNWTYYAITAPNNQTIASAYTSTGYLNQGETVFHIVVKLGGTNILPAGTTYQVYGIEV